MAWPAQVTRYRTSLTFALRLTIAALLALWIAHLADMRLPLWVVLTAMIVTQTSLGRSLKVALDYFAGTLLGAVWGGLVVIFTPQGNEAALLASLAAALAPLAFLTALEPRYATAPITAAIVLLMTQSAALSPLASVLERLMEVGVGGAIGLFVSVFLLPASAFQQIRDVAARALDEMAKTVAGFADGFWDGLDVSKVRALQAAIGPLLAELDNVAGEAGTEKGLRIGAEEPGPLLRSLQRLRHDLVIIGRAAEHPLPAALVAHFAACGHVIEAYFKQSAAALCQRLPAPPLEEVDAAVMTCTAAVKTARRAGELRGLTSDEVEHLFAMGFALEQMRRNLGDLNRCISEWAA